MHSDNWLKLRRTVRFGDTDAAGVMHFHQLLRWCHEAYEQSLEAFGVAPACVFPMAAADRPAGLEAPAVALPIVHCSADFRRPLVCGDPLLIQLEPVHLDPGSFEVRYRFQRIRSGEPPQDAALGLTRHLAIEAASRQRGSLPDPVQRWLEAAAVAAGDIRPV
ncbi:MAG: thioesterase family protein [Synechococcaceae cyanobacterium ELA263]